MKLASYLLSGAALSVVLLGGIMLAGAGPMVGRAVAAEMSPVAKVGETAPNFSLKDTDGQTHTLSDLKGKIVIIEFDATRCPVAKAYDDRMIKFVKDHVLNSDGKVVWLSINSNEKPMEDVAEIKEMISKLGIPYPILKDDGSKVADQYAATVTPHMYIVDAQGVLRYKGAFDDNMHEDKVTKHFVADAIDALLAGKSVPVAETKAKGCSIKRAG